MKHLFKEQDAPIDNMELRLAEVADAALRLMHQDAYWKQDGELTIEGEKESEMRFVQKHMATAVNAAKEAAGLAVRELAAKAIFNQMQVEVEVHKRIKWKQA